MFDVKTVQAEAEAEIAAEQASKAKSAIKSKLREIAAAKKVLANLEGEYQEILRDIGTA